MGDPAPSNQLSAPFPGPPSFYQHFTKENLEHLVQLLKEKGPVESVPKSDLPSSLEFLRPPTPPANGTYHSFGEERSLDAPLSTLPPNIRILPQPPPSEAASAKIPIASPSNLLQLTRSLLLSYLELLHLLQATSDAGEYGPKWEDLRDLFHNAHSIVNAYRGWQGRESLIALLEGEIKRGRDSVKEWGDMEERVNTNLKTLIEDATKSSRSLQTPERTNGEQSGKNDSKRMWNLLSQELG